MPIVDPMYQFVPAWWDQPGFLYVVLILLHVPRFQTVKYSQPISVLMAVLKMNPVYMVFPHYFFSHSRRETLGMSDMWLLSSIQWTPRRERKHWSNQWFASVFITKPQQSWWKARCFLYITVRCLSILVSELEYMWQNTLASCCCYYDCCWWGNPSISLCFFPYTCDVDVLLWTKTFA